jgi:hypothetical protein
LDVTGRGSKLRKERGEEKRKGDLKTTGQKQKKISYFKIYITE